MKFGPHTFSSDAFPVVAGPCVVESERHVLKMARLLVADMRVIPIMQELGAPVIFDATHSAQLPGYQGDRSGGLRQYIPAVARAAVAAGCDGLFLEVHDQPDKALSDSATQWPFDRFESLMADLQAFHKTYVEVRHRD